jgi:hypothetical protein
MKIELFSIDLFPEATHGFSILKVETDNHVWNLLDVHFDIITCYKTRIGEVSRVVRKIRVYWDLFCWRWIYAQIIDWKMSREVKAELDSRFGKKEDD